MKIQRTNISHFFHFNLMSSLPIFIDENTSFASFPCFSTLTLSRLYLFSSMKLPSIFFILLCVKLLLTYFYHIYEQTCFISHFFYFNLDLAIPILIDENTKNTRKIASIPVFCLIGRKITSYLLD